MQHDVTSLSYSQCLPIAHAHVYIFEQLQFSLMFIIIITNNCTSTRHMKEVNLGRSV